MAEDLRRFIADAEDMAIGIGPDDALRFIGIGLLRRLKEAGQTEEQIYTRIRPGHTVMLESQLIP